MTFRLVQRWQRALWLTAAVYASACQRVGDGATVSSADTPQPIDVAQLGAQGVGPMPVAMGRSGGAGAAASGMQLGFVTQATFVRGVASEAKDWVPNGHTRRQPNWLATLYRGEQVTILSDVCVQGSGGETGARSAPGNRNAGAEAGVDAPSTLGSGWLHVRTSDAQLGWVKEQNVLTATGVDMATVVVQTRVFGRPDLLALNGSRTVAPGTLLFVLRSKDQFSEVNLAGSATGWVLSAALIKEGPEVDAAKLIDRARLLQEKKDAAAQGVLELARSHYSNTRLVQALLSPGALGTPGALSLPSMVSEPQKPATLGAPGVAAPAAQSMPAAPGTQATIGNDPAFLPAGAPVNGAKAILPIDAEPQAPEMAPAGGRDAAGEPGPSREGEVRQELP